MAILSFRSIWIWRFSLPGFVSFCRESLFHRFTATLKEGLITEEECVSLKDLPRDHVDYGALYYEIWPILRLAYDRFKSSKRNNFSIMAPSLSFEKIKDIG